MYNAEFIGEVMIQTLILVSNCYLYLDSNKILKI